MDCQSWKERTASAQQQLPWARKREGRVGPEGPWATELGEPLSHSSGQVTEAGVWGVGLNHNLVETLSASLRSSNGSPWLLARKLCLIGVSSCILFPPQWSQDRPQPSQASPAGLPKLWLPIRDVHSAEAGAPDLPAHRQGQGRRRPSKQDQPPGLRPPTSSFPAGNQTRPDSGVFPATGTRGFWLQGAPSARHPPEDLDS